MKFEKVTQKLTSITQGITKKAGQQATQSISQSTKTLSAQKTLSTMDTMSTSAKTAIKRPTKLSKEAIKQLKENPNISRKELRQFQQKVRKHQRGKIPNRIGTVYPRFHDLELETCKTEGSFYIPRNLMAVNKDAGNSIIKEAQRGADALIDVTGNSGCNTIDVADRAKFFDEYGLTKVEKEILTAERKAKLMEKYGEKLKAKK